MYFWNIELLKKQLSSQGLTETQLFYYILISVAFSSIGTETVKYISSPSPHAWTYIQSILFIVISIYGTFMTFRANGGAYGVQFAARFFSIGLVATIRLSVLLIPLFVGLMIYWAIAFGFEEEIPPTFAEVALLSSWYFMLYFNMAKHIRDVAQSKG